METNSSQIDVMEQTFLLFLDLFASAKIRMNIVCICTARSYPKNFYHAYARLLTIRQRLFVYLLTNSSHTFNIILLRCDSESWYICRGITYNILFI